MKTTELHNRNARSPGDWLADDTLVSLLSASCDSQAAEQKNPTTAADVFPHTHLLLLKTADEIFSMLTKRVSSLQPSKMELAAPYNTLPPPTSQKGEPDLSCFLEEDGCFTSKPLTGCHTEATDDVFFKSLGNYDYCYLSSNTGGNQQNSNNRCTLGWGRAKARLCRSDSSLVPLKLPRNSGELTGLEDKVIFLAAAYYVVLERYL